MKNVAKYKKTVMIEKQVYLDKVVVVVKVFDKSWLSLDTMHRVPSMNQQFWKSFDPVFSILKNKTIFVK